ncbi:MAG: glycosyltransferase [Ignavibacteriaceae bacterium]
MENLAPIILFVYNRPEHTRQTLEYLSKNKLAESFKLFIFSDGPKTEKDQQKVSEVRDLLKNIKGFKEIKIAEREKNLGLANSVINGVNQIFKSYEKVIVLEDDIISSPSFLKFMNDALDFYKADEKIFSVSGYPYPVKIPASYNKDVFIAHRASSWGWGTWKDRWQKVDWELKDYSSLLKNIEDQNLLKEAGEDLLPMLKAQIKDEVDSWAIRWTYTQLKNNAFCLYPVSPLCKNIGTDWSGTHSSSSKKLNVELNLSGREFRMTNDLQINSEIEEQIQNLFKLSPVRRIINYFKYLSLN